MPHDFDKDDEKIPRFDSKNRTCLGIGGIMDYSETFENDKTQWSTCSVEAFTLLMNENETCLAEIDQKNPPSFLLPTVGERECDLSKIFPGLNGVHYIKLNGNVFLKLN